MRNPIRLKNLSLRFAPWYAAGLGVLLLSDVSWRSLALGSIPVAAGLGIRAWACGHLVKTERFSVTGPYARVRHPLYLGTILIAVGFATMLGGWWSPAALAFVVVWFGASYYPRKERTESARLESRYGEIYRRYRDEVPPLLPSLRAWRPPSADAENVGTGARWSLACYDDNNELGTCLAVLAGLGVVALRASLG